MTNTENKQLDDFIGALDGNQIERLERAIKAFRKRTASSGKGDTYRVETPSSTHDKAIVNFMPLGTSRTD